MKTNLFRFTIVVVMLAMLLTACAPAATVAPAAPAAPAATQPPAAPAATEPPAQPAATEAPAQPAATEAPAVTEAPSATPTLTPYPMATPEAGKIPVRWYIGLGTGTDANQLPLEQAVVDAFNKDPERANDKIQVIMEVIPYNSAKDTLATEIASGNAPDVVGPVGWSGSNTFFGQWLDLADLIKSSNFDTSVFDKSLVDMYVTGEEGTVGLPFAVYPSALFYNTAMFDEAGLEYPPAKYGDKYKMPDGSEVEWSWDTLTQVARLLTVDANGKNATEDGFDKTKIVQYGYTWQFENHANYWGSYWANGSILQPGGSKGSYKAQIPDAWKASWQWTYDGIWGDKPFIANNAVEQSADFGAGNPFNSGKIAMTDEPAWYTCCIGNVKTWDLAAMPAYKGKVAGRIDADTFRILKSTKHPQEAFKFLTYLVTAGVDSLIVGTKDVPPAYGAIPSIASKRQPFIDAKKEQFPWVKNWDTLLAGLQYPDVPSSEGATPNFANGWNRIATFSNLLSTTAGLDLAKEEDTLVKDLDVIFNK